MATNYTDQFFLIDPANPPASGAQLSVVQLVLTDQNDDGDIDRFSNDAVDGIDVRSSYAGDTVRIQTPDGQTITYTGTTFYLSDGREVFTPTDGQVLQPGAFTSSTYVTSQAPLLVSQLGPPCFVEGMMISTPSGPRAVQGLKPGDLVNTLDRGPCPIVALRHRRLSLEDLRKNPRHAPVRLPVSVFGGFGPDLLVSPQHRLLLRSKVAERMFGQSEVLAPAAQLIGHAGIARDAVSTPVTYIHVILDHHAILQVNDVASESLLLAPNALAALDRETRVHLQKTLPIQSLTGMHPARILVSGKRLKTLLQRHEKNDLPLCSADCETHPNRQAAG